MDRKRTVGLLFVVVVLAGCLLLVLGRDGTEREPRGPRAEGTTTAPAPAPARADTPSPRPEPTHAAAPMRLVPATRAEDSAEPLGAFEGRVISATTGEGVEGAELTFASAGGATSTRS